MKRKAEVLLGGLGVIGTVLPFVWLLSLSRLESESAWMTYFVGFPPIFGFSWLIAGSCFIGVGYRLVDSARSIVTRFALGMLLLAGYAQIGVGAYRLARLYMRG